MNAQSADSDVLATIGVVGNRWRLRRRHRRRRLGPIHMITRALASVRPFRDGERERERRNTFALNAAVRLLERNRGPTDRRREGSGVAGRDLSFQIQLKQWVGNLHGRGEERERRVGGKMECLGGLGWATRLFCD